MATREISNSDLARVLGFMPAREQLAAITAPLEPGMIVAGAGTGKTAVMSARIVWLIMTGQVSPDKVLGLTFTKKAAYELLSRVRGYLDEANRLYGDVYARDTTGEPTISTYNAFGARLLKEHGLRLGYEPDARVVVDATRYQLAMRVVRNTNLDLAACGFSSTSAVEKLMDLDDHCSNYLVEPQRVITGEQERLVWLKSLDKPQVITRSMIATCEVRIVLAHLVQEFRDAKKRAGIIDYSDQIRLAATAAQMSPEMCELVRQQYQVVLLDEYQDTSISQKVLLQSLFGAGHPVMAVGDPCQAIYQWRGAEISNMESFVRDFPRFKGDTIVESSSFTLSVNRRSGKLILKAANTLSGILRGLHRSIIELVTDDDSKPIGNVHVAQLLTFDEEVEWIAEQIKNLAPKSWSDVALLLREKKHTANYCQALESAGIPVQVTSADALINLPEVREVVSYLQVIADPSANVALARILMGPRWRIGHRDMALLGQHARKLAKIDDSAETIEVTLDHVVAGVDRSQQVSLLDALELAESTPHIQYSPEARTRFIAAANEFRELRKYVGESAVDVISRIIRVTGIGIEALIRQEAGTTRFDRLAALLDLAGDYRNLEGDSSVHAFLGFLRDSERFNTKTEAQIATMDDAVIIMTVHQSKGLEFPIVVVPEMTKDVFPSKRKGGLWPTAPELLPYDYMPKQLDDRLTAFPPLTGPTSTNIKEFKEIANQVHHIDERRLAYVAVTRAKELVIASSSWWGPTQKTMRGASDYLTELKAQATVVSEWVDEPLEDKNPFLGEIEGTPWPVPIDSDYQSELAQQAALVDSVPMPVTLGFFTGVGAYSFDDLSDEQVDMMLGWNSDVDALIEQVEQYGQTQRIVAVPPTLSASQAIMLTENEEAFLKSLIRPMPRKPSAAADRGTAFHLWVEDYYGNRPLIGLDELPGASDSEIYDDAQLDSLKQAFESGQFAQRVPQALEEEFALIAGPHTLRGRIDAIFKGGLSDASDPSRLTVIDWKTGKSGSANELQLSIYRLAVAQKYGVDADSVDVGFYYVGEQHFHQPARLLSLDELITLLNG